MAALDTKARAAASKLLAKFGKACTLNRTAPGTYDPATGIVANTTTVYPINLYLEAPNAQDLAGGQIVQSDEVAIFPALGLAVEPVPNDTITVDSKARTVKSVSKIWSGAQVALWRVAVTS